MDKELAYVGKVLWVIVFMIAVQRFGIEIGPLIAGLGVTGFIIGFACQESLANLPARIMIALNQPFRIGDLVEVGGVLGVVDEKKMMATTLHIPDNKKVEMPDSSVNLVVRPWCKTKDYWNVYFSVNHAAKEALDQAGIEIPFPQMDVHHYSLDKIKT